MPTHAPRPTDCLRWILATCAACLGACVGTPTPEPPDTLPRPNDGLIFGATVELTNFPTDNTVPPIPVGGSAGAVPPGSDVWVVNLDRDSVPPLTLRATANGSFDGKISGQDGDRVRIIARTDTQHSLPLDAFVMPIDARQSALAPLPPQGLSCLSLAAEDLTSIVREGKDSTRKIELRSTCREPVTLGARLRFGDAGFVVEAPASVNGAASITVRITGHDDPREHADILLLDVQSGTQTGRYALGLWSVAAASLGD